MGWAKYAEDDQEIIQDRLYIKQQEMLITISPNPNNNHGTRVLIEFANRKEVNKYNNRVQVLKSKCIQCKDCGRVFDFSVSMQEQYKRNNWSAPKRCKACREYKKIRQLMRS